MIGMSVTPWAECKYRGWGTLQLRIVNNYLVTLNAIEDALSPQRECGQTWCSCGTCPIRGDVVYSSAR